MTELDAKDIRESANTNMNLDSATSGSGDVTGYDVRTSPVDVSRQAPSAPSVPAKPSEPESHNEDPFAHEEDHVEHIQAEDPPNLPIRPNEPSHPEENVPQEVEGLKAMFPDFDVAILQVLTPIYVRKLLLMTLNFRQSVLGSVGGNQERAADVLLGMSDPNYQPQHQTGPVRACTFVFAFRVSSFLPRPRLNSMRNLPTG